MLCITSAGCIGPPYDVFSERVLAPCWDAESTDQKELGCGEHRPKGAGEWRALTFAY